MKCKNTAGHCCSGMIGGILGSMLTVAGGVCLLCLLCPQIKTDLCCCLSKGTAETGDREETE